MQRMDEQTTAVEFDTEAALAFRKDCDEILLMSKTTPKEHGFARIEAVDPQHCPCRCFSPNLRREILVYNLKHTFAWHWPAEITEPCDELASANVMQGCWLTGRGTLKLRHHKCGETGHHLVGCEEARILIYRPSPTGWEVVFAGRLQGTVGLEPHADGRARCCALNHHEGSIRARGVGGMKECTLCATYKGTFDKLDPETICKGVKVRYTGHTDGVVCCPCPGHKEEKYKEEG